MSRTKKKAKAIYDPDGVENGERYSKKSIKSFSKNYIRNRSQHWAMKRMRAGSLQFYFLFYFAVIYKAPVNIKMTRL